MSFFSLERQGRTDAGKLRAVFKDVGRDGNWNSAFGFGNPAASNKVKCYLQAVTSEQLQAAVMSKQATPLFVKKLSALPAHITCKMLELCFSAALLCPITRVERYFPVSSALGADLATRFLFNPLTPQYMLDNKHLSTEACDHFANFRMS